MNNEESNKIWEMSVKKVNNSLDLAEEKEFEKIKDSEQVQKALKQARQIYFKTLNSFLIKKIDKEKNWRYIKNQIAYSSRIKIFLIHFSKYVAVALVAFVTGIMVPRLFIPEIPELANNSIELEWGQTSKMRLSDGTQVWLNAGTIFEYPTVFDTKSRSVKLVGEAQFKVTHNNEIPFEVKTKSGVIKVYGTTFNVTAYDDDPELTVTLLEGKVAVENTNGDHLATLDPSEQFRINKISGKTTIKKVDTNFYSSWVDGKVLLNETKLSELTTILKRWYNVEIQLVGDDIGNIKISGSISKGKPLDLFLKILERMYGLKYELKTYDNKKDELIIYKN